MYRFFFPLCLTKSHWKSRQDTSAKEEMISNNFNINTRWCVTANSKIAVLWSLKELIWILTAALEHSIYVANPFSLHPGKHMHLSF